MSNPRVLLVLLTIMAMVAAPLVVPAYSLGTPVTGRVFAATAGAPATQDNDDSDDNDDGDDDDNDSNDDDADDDDDTDDEDDEDDDNGDNDNNGDEDDGDGDDDNGDDDDDAPPAVAPAAAPAPSPNCSTPGQEIVFVSGDGRVAVRVFPNMGQSIKFSIRQPIDSAAVPPTPGPIVGGLLFQLIAETCDGSPIAVLPAEVNLGISYSDDDASGLNEANFSIARLDTNSNQWQASTKQATDPPANYTSATITDMGYYVLHQRP